MSLLTASDLVLLGQVADELREVFSARGYRVTKALDTDPSFGSGQSRAALARDLALETVSGAASRVGLDFRSVNGSGREIRTMSQGVDRRFRFRHGRRMDSGLRVPVSSNSALLTHPDAELSLIPTENWAFIWTTNDDMIVDETIVAPILDVTVGSPGFLVLGPEISVGQGGPSPASAGFLPSDEPLEGFDDDDYQHEIDDVAG